MAPPAPVKALDERIQMLDGRSIPMFGLGVYMMTDEETYQSCLWALEAGYRHIDGAEWYENEGQMGRAVQDFCKKSGVPRSDIFITSKLMHNTSYDQAASDLRKSLKRTGVDYFDLYLMHSAIGGPKIRADIWRAITEAQEEGLVRSIGVSNFGEQHIQEFIDKKFAMPVVNQIDLHPFMRHLPIVEICEKHGILLEAWGPLARAYRMDHPVMVKVAKARGKSVAQVFLRWGLQHGFVVIPKTVSQKRIVENAQIFDFELTQEDMHELDQLDEYLVTDWDVVGCE